MLTQNAIQPSTALRGQVLRVPDLHPFFAHWPSGVSPHLGGVSEALQRKLDEWKIDGKLRSKVLEIDIPRMIASWYPNITPGRLKTLVFYTLWLFIWDDSYDESDGLCDELTRPAMDCTHRQMLEYVAFCLGLTATATAPGAEVPLPPSRVAALLGGPARDMKSDYHEPGRQRFFDALKFYLDSLVEEQDYLVRREMPSVKIYREHRQDTSAVYTYCAMIEYIIGAAIPQELFGTAELSTLWDETNRLISCNGYNIVPVITHETGQSIDAAAASVLADIYNGVDTFDRAADALLRSVRDPDKAPVVMEYIDALRSSVTGCLSWSLANKRYDMEQYIGSDGSLVIPL